MVTPRRRGTTLNCAPVSPAGSPTSLVFSELNHVLTRSLTAGDVQFLASLDAVKVNTFGRVVLLLI